jgi:hypothetical protein
MQQTVGDGATAHATAVQQQLRERSNHADVMCNTERNSGAISLKNLCNKQSADGATSVASKPAQSNVVDLRMYLLRLCRNLPIPPEHLLRCYFTTEDVTDIRNGRYPDVDALAALIKTDPRYPFHEDSQKK